MLEEVQQERKVIATLEREHETKSEKAANYGCGVCGSKFTESRSVIRHMKTVHGCQTYAKCTHCTQIYGYTSSCGRHEEHALETHTQVSEKNKSKIEQQKAKHAIGKLFQSFRIQADNQIDVFNFVTEQLGYLELFVRNKIAEFGPLKFQLSVFVQILKPTDDTKVRCHANTQSKFLTTEPSDDEILEMLTK